MSRRGLPFTFLSKRHQSRLLDHEIQEEFNAREEPEAFQIDSDVEELYENTLEDESNENEVEMAVLPAAPETNTCNEGLEEVPEEDLEAQEGTDESSEYEYFYQIESDDTSDEEDDPDELFVDDLAEFCLTHLPDYATDQLLKLLGGTKKFPKLPKTHSTLYGDIKDLPRPVTVGGGHIMYLGIQTNLQTISVEQVPDVLEVEFSYDGVRLHKSSKKSMWPIVMSMPSLPELGVRLIGIFVGHKKFLQLNEFLFCLIEELQQIYSNSSIVEVGPKKLKTRLKVSRVIADNPAKTYGLGKVKVLKSFPERL